MHRHSRARAFHRCNRHPPTTRAPSPSHCQAILPSSLLLFDSLLHPNSSTRIPHHYSNTHSLYPPQGVRSTRLARPHPVRPQLNFNPPRVSSTNMAYRASRGRKQAKKGVQLTIMVVGECLPLSALPCYDAPGLSVHRVACSRDALDRSSIAPASTHTQPLFAYMRTGRLCACGTPSSPGFPHRSHNRAR